MERSHPAPGARVARELNISPSTVSKAVNRGKAFVQQTGKEAFLF